MNVVHIRNTGLYYSTVRPKSYVQIQCKIFTKMKYPLECSQVTKIAKTISIQVTYKIKAAYFFMGHGVYIDNILH